MQRASYLIAFLAAVLAAIPAWAQQALTEYETAPYSLAVHPRMAVRVLPQDSAQTLDFAKVMPPDVAGLDLLELKWPKSNQTCVIAVGQTGASYGKPQGDPRIALAVNTLGHGPEKLPLDNALAQGMLSRLCAWPTLISPEAELVVLAAISMGRQDSRIIAFTVAPSGALTLIDTGNAAAVYGWFECVDLNDDGSYELVTSRNLDGTQGGLCYHAVRAYDQAARKFVARPDSYTDYFTHELSWLDWLLTTCTAIQGDPPAYASKAPSGPVYVATFEGQVYGFDTLIELPTGTQLVEDVPAYNAARRVAVALVRKYRDELKAWLDGGAYPATWNMPK